MKRKSRILTLVAAAWVVGAPASLPPPAAGQASADPTRLDRYYWPQGSDTGRPGESSSRAQSASDYHANYHADYSADRGNRAAPRPEETRDARRDRPMRDWPASRDPGRPTRPPLGWRR